MIHATALPGVRCPALRGLDLGGWKRPCVCACVCECGAKCGQAGARERGIVGQSSGPSLASLAFLLGPQGSGRDGEFRARSTGPLVSSQPYACVCVPVCWYAVCVNKYVYVSLYRCERKRESAQKKEAESAVQRLFVFLKIDETPEKFPPTLPLNQQLSGWQGKP